MSEDKEQEKWSEILLAAYDIPQMVTRDVARRAIQDHIAAQLDEIDDEPMDAVGVAGAIISKVIAGAADGHLDVELLPLDLQETYIREPSRDGRPFAARLAGQLNENAANWRDSSSRRLPVEDFQGVIQDLIDRIRDELRAELIARRSGLVQS